MPDGAAETTDVAIIGAGPIGLELAAALASAGVDYVQLEAGNVGATMQWWAPGTRYFSSPERLEIAGVPLVTTDHSKATREQYLAYLRLVVRVFNLDVRTYRRVTSVDRDGEAFVLTVERSEHGVGGPEESGERAYVGDASAGDTTRVRARRLVLAIGNMHRARRLDVMGENLPHVSHYLDDLHRYFGGRVLIVGGKNSAAEAALRCYRCGATVTMSYRGDQLDPERLKYWIRPELEWLIQKGRIGWHPRTVPETIERDRVRLASLDGGAPSAVIADHVLLLTGYVQDPALFEQLGLALAGSARAPVLDRKRMEASVPGVFVAGTAMAGTQERARVFIENSHVHVDRIVRALTGREPAWAKPADYSGLEES